MHNFAYAVRSLRRTPTLTAAVVVTLALCIGATTAIFSVIYAVLFRPLPFADPGGILVVRETWKGLQGSMSVGNWWDIKRTDRVFQHLVPMNAASVNLAGTESPENVTGARVGADFFALLGVKPTLGRAFLPEEDRPGADGVVLLGDGLRVYGVISYGVSQRTQEIGIRVVLGADNRRVLALVVGHAAALTGAGLLLGLAGALGLASVIAGLLFQVSPTDPPTL
ncbi:MAG: FtsX-like permease family protein, partial [Gemmatimonadales bacterium]